MKTSREVIREKQEKTEFLKCLQKKFLVFADCEKVEPADRLKALELAYEIEKTFQK